MAFTVTRPPMITRAPRNAVLQRQFRSGSTGGVALWSTPALLLAHKRLEELKEEVMPEGDLHLLLRFERVLPAKDCASRLGCTVAEYLAKVVCLPMCLPIKIIEQRQLTSYSEVVCGWRRRQGAPFIISVCHGADISCSQPGPHDSVGGVHATVLIPRHALLWLWP